MTISRSTTRVSIVDNDTIVPAGQLPLLHVRDAVVDEKDGVALVSVLLGGPTGQASLSTVTVNYATANGTAAAGSDYATSSGTLTFAPGETTKTIPVAITDDDDGELAERFTLNLSNALNGAISDGSGVVTIGASDQDAGDDTAHPRADGHDRQRGRRLRRPGRATVHPEYEHGLGRLRDAELDRRAAATTATPTSRSPPGS